MSVVALWFRLGGRVDQRTYLLSGLLLMALKYALDAGAVYLSDGHVLTPPEFFSPLLSTRQRLLGSGHGAVLIAMFGWSLVFLWIGLTMSVRRAVDAGLGPATGLLFVLPIVNLVVMLGLALLPSQPNSQWQPRPSDAETSHFPIRAALLGLLASVAVGAAMVGFGAALLGEYGLALFVATPFSMGCVVTWIFNRPRIIERKPPATLASTLGVTTLSIALTGGALLLLALEGALCLAMAFLPALLAALLGSIITWVIMTRDVPVDVELAALLVLLPFSAAATSALPVELVEREVLTVVEIDAPPARVWPNVVGFSELPPPSKLVFQLGIAYPIRAQIEGRGVGAVRYCEFSTGPFVEPITEWVPPVEGDGRLAFDVARQPPPMTEQSPYRNIHPPHLDGYLRSRRGEFRLIALPNGRTRLEGRTWYTLDLAPATYWALWSDALIHEIHRRVLQHIRALSESQKVVRSNPGRRDLPEKPTR